MFVVGADLRNGQQVGIAKTKDKKQSRDRGDQCDRAADPSAAEAAQLRRGFQVVANFFADLVDQHLQLIAIALAGCETAGAGLSARSLSKSESFGSITVGYGRSFITASWVFRPLPVMLMTMLSSLGIRPDWI